MQIDYAHLRDKVRDFLRTPEFDEVSRKAEISVPFAVVGCTVAGLFGLAAMCTIVLAKPGFTLFRQGLGAIFTGAAFRNGQAYFQRNPDRAVPLVGAVVVAGPRYGMVLGSFADSTRGDTRFLARKAADLSNAYEAAKRSQVGTGKGNEELYALLRDDEFKHRRRRRIPKNHAEGRDLLLFDIEVNRREVLHDDGAAWVLLVAVPDEPPSAEYQGQSIQIPWHVADAALS